MLYRKAHCIFSMQYYIIIPNEHLNMFLISLQNFFWNFKFIRIIQKDLIINMDRLHIK